MILTSLIGIVFVAILYVFMYGNFKIQDYLESRKGYSFHDALSHETFGVAPALRRIGLCLGVALGMTGVIVGPSTGLFNDIILVTAYGSLIFVLFIFARYINDFLVLHGINNTEEIYERSNVSVGVVEFSCFVATGIMAMASMSGTGTPMSAIAYFAIGQLLLLLTVFGYEKLTRWSVIDAIRAGSLSVGIHIGGIALALSVALYGIIAQDFETYGYMIYSLVFEGALALALLFGLAVTIDKLFLPSLSIKDELANNNNIGLALMLAGMHIVGGLAISAAIT